MADREAMRVVFRDLVSGGGDIVDIALAARRRGWGEHSVQAAAALRTEFAVPIREALAFAAWIEGTDDTAEARAVLRTDVPTVLR